MKRTRTEVTALNSEDLSTKRIVRRKITTSRDHHRERSLSPVEDLEPQSRREVRNTPSSVLKYIKYSSEQRASPHQGKYNNTSSKYKFSDCGEGSENKFHRFDQRVSSAGRGKGRGNNIPDDLERGGEITRISRRVSSREHNAHSNHSETGAMRFTTTFHDRFDFSLRIGALDLDMHDGELKTCLFNLFKHFGYVHIKVLGRGIERHAFINFLKKEDAQRAVSEMSGFTIEGVSLKTEWSKSTVHRYPEVINNPFLTRSRRNTISTTRPSRSRTHHHDDHYDNYGGGGGGARDSPSRHSSGSREKTSFSAREVTTSRRSHEIARDVVHPRDISPHEMASSRRISRELGPRDQSDIDPRESRDITYEISESISPPASSHHDRSHHSSSGGGGGGGGGAHSSSSRQEPRAVVPITDPSATRTLFVGNLELDITEQELRDLFGPYGRIESVDIKTQRVSGATYAFVKFLTINDAINAKNDMHGRKYGEYRLKIGFGRGAPSGKVWIGNLTCVTDFKEVQQELDRFGLIRKTDYQDGDNHAYVQLDSLDAAQAAIASLTGHRIRNSGRVLKIDLCKPMHLRDDPDFHLRQAPLSERSLSQDEQFTDSPPIFKRKVREQEYNHHYHQQHHHGNSGGTSVRRVKNEIDNHIPARERIVSSSSGKGRNSREETRHEYRKRVHSPPPGRDGSTYHSGRGHSDNLNGVTDYHNKRPRIGSESGSNGRRDEKERDRGVRDHRERHRRDHHDVESRRTGSERKEHNGKRESDRSERGDTDKKDKKSTSDEKTEKEEPAKPVLEPTPSDIVAAKDTALKLDSVPEQLAMNAGASDGTSSLPETLNDLAILYPVAWRGNLVLKNTGFPTRMHLVGGDPAVAETLLRTRDSKDYIFALRITQRLRLEQPRLEEVNKRMVSAGPSGYCVLLALPGPIPSAPLSPESSDTMQLRPLKSLVSYLKQKEAAGIVALSGADGSDAASASADRDVVGVLHAFPPCEFSQSKLTKIAPSLGQEPAKEDHIVVLLVKGNV